uniref:ABC transporter ATP-binding protein n=1 Tax=Thermosporothrix sp. COM3 TaxID=2490863 RepID=A0A455SFA7_9CHLR|nr:ABC transporter ATP-binding protein [Thermosporothrix sp. COM3]
MLVYDVQDVVKYYPGQTKAANEHITLQIQEGTIFGILGDNGAGKSTLIRQMVNLLQSTSGSIKLYGHELKNNPQLVPQLVGYMPQRYEALNNLTVDEALYFTAHLRGMTRNDARQERERLLKLWQIEDLRHKYSSRLSGGQQRIVRLAVAAAGRLPVLILDEPTNDLDPLRRKMVWDILRQLNADYGTTIIFITHDAIEAEKIVQRIAILHDGRLLVEGSLSELKQIVGKKMRLELTFTPGLPPTLPEGLTPHEVMPGRWLVMLDWEQVGPVLSALSREHCDDVRLYTATLEDIYLHYVTA